MCGHDWWSVRISKEITDFYSGKDEQFQPEKLAMKSPGLSNEAVEILKKRKSACHSDNAKDEKKARVVQFNTLKAHDAAGLSAEMHYGKHHNQFRCYRGQPRVSPVARKCQPSG